MAGILCVGGAAVASLGPIAAGLVRQFQKEARPMTRELLWLTAVGCVACVTGFLLSEAGRRRARRRCQKGAGLT